MRVELCLARRRRSAWLIDEDVRGSRGWPCLVVPVGDVAFLIRKSSRGRANGTTGSASLCRGAGRGKPQSGGGFEGDLVAECFELSDVVTFLAFRAGAVVVEIGTQVVEAGLGVGEQVPDDDQDGAAESDDGSFFAATSGDAPVAFAEESVGLAGGYGGLAECAGQVAVTVSGAAGC